MRCLLETSVVAVLAAFVAAVPAARAELPTANLGTQPTPGLPDVEPKPQVHSRVPFVVGVELNWAKLQLEDQIPKLLYQTENREVSAGIWLDARVTRGTLDLRVRDDRAMIVAPVELHLDVRSKFGSLVMPLGRCRSTLDVEVDLLTKLAPDGKLGRPTVKTNLREPCRLSGFDVTPIIEGEIARRLSAAEPQIAEHLARANQQIANIHHELFRSLSSHAAGCVRFMPEKLQQSPITEEQGVAVARLVVDGTIANRCEPAVPQSPVVETLSGPATFDLGWPRRIGMADLGQVLTQRFAANGLKGVGVQVRAVRLDDVDQLALHLRLLKREGWLFARPEIRSQRVVLGSIASKDQELLKAARATLDSVAIPIDTLAIDLLAQKLVATSNAISIVFGSSPTLKEPLQIRPSAVHSSFELLLDRDALVVVVHRRQAE
jgi:hypothetical protein